MSIERDPQIVFDPDGTLKATTNWIGKHDEGLAELLKNVHYAYFPTRANVDPRHHVAAILLVDSANGMPARIGVLDVGGATAEDLARWSIWQDQTASMMDGLTQGNGGKAYLYRMFTGQARLLGVRSGRRNCKGFEGEPGSTARGTPGFMPSLAAGREAPVSSVLAELDEALRPYRLDHTQLPGEVLGAIRFRQAFSLAEGVDPKDVYKGRLNAQDLLEATLLHEQAAVVIEQIRVFAIHNGAVANEGNPLTLDAIAPFPGFETARIFEVPDTLPDQDGSPQSTTLGARRERGRLVLQTSKDNMDSNWRRLRPRWKVSYRTRPDHPIGSKKVSELVPTTPGSPYVYAAVELPALDPDYVVVGRVRPSDGPLMRALDRFVADKLRELASEINATRRHELDQKGLEAVQRENQQLDQWKNQFLPLGGDSGDGAGEGEGSGGRKRRGTSPVKYGKTPAFIEMQRVGDTLRVGRGATTPMAWFLQPIVRDVDGLPIRNPQFLWKSDAAHVADFLDPKDGRLTAKAKGRCSIYASLPGTKLRTDDVPIEVWEVDHVLLAPRLISLPLGERQPLVAEITDDEGNRSSEVLLNWEHDADDPLLVRLRPDGVVLGNRIGRTTVSAGVGDPSNGGVWARVRAEIEVIPNPSLQGKGGGFPTLKVTDRDIDPETGEVRSSDPDEPPLWQGVSDYKNNIWWLNLGSKEAEAAYSQKNENPRVWRLYHAQKVVEMVVQVHMQAEFTAKSAGEMPGLWSDHLAAFSNFQKQYIPVMWEKLNDYVATGSGLD